MTSKPASSQKFPSSKPPGHRNDQITWVQSFVRSFNEEILVGLQVKESDRKNWDPVLDWFREVLMARALLNTKDMACWGGSYREETDQLRAMIYKICGILQMTWPFNAAAPPSFEDFLAMKTSQPFAHQLVTAFHNTLNSRLERNGISEANIPDIRGWVDDHLLVHALVETNSRMHLGIGDETATRARAAACVNVRWESGELSFVFPTDIRRGFPPTSGNR